MLYRNLLFISWTTNFIGKKIGTLDGNTYLQIVVNNFD